MIRATVTDLARAHGCTDEQLDDVRLAVSEAATNAIVHGSRFNSEIAVEVHGSDGEFTVVIGDEGAGMQPRADSPGAGLGLPLIAQLTDRLEVTSTESGTQVWMVFSCGDRPLSQG